MLLLASSNGAALVMHVSSLSLFVAGLGEILDAKASPGRNFDKKSPKLAKSFSQRLSQLVGGIFHNKLFLHGQNLLEFAELNR